MFWQLLSAGRVVKQSSGTDQAAERSLAVCVSASRENLRTRKERLSRPMRKVKGCEVPSERDHVIDAIPFRHP